MLPHHRLCHRLCAVQHVRSVRRILQFGGVRAGPAAGARARSHGRAPRVSMRSRIGRTRSSATSDRKRPTEAATREGEVSSCACARASA
eukprot:5239166-Pleurochrysis_carterae.AAC.2